MTKDYLTYSKPDLIVNKSEYLESNKPRGPNTLGRSFKSAKRGQLHESDEDAGELSFNYSLVSYTDEQAPNRKVDSIIDTLNATKEQLQGASRRLALVDLLRSNQTFQAILKQLNEKFNYLIDKHQQSIMRPAEKKKRVNTQRWVALIDKDIASNERLMKGFYSELSRLEQTQESINDPMYGWTELGTR